MEVEGKTDADEGMLDALDESGFLDAAGVQISGMTAEQSLSAIAYATEGAEGDVTKKKKDKKDKTPKAIEDGDPDGGHELGRDGLKGQWGMRCREWPAAFKWNRVNMGPPNCV